MNTGYHLHGARPARPGRGAAGDTDSHSGGGVRIAAPDRRSAERRAVRWQLELAVLGGGG